jgi:chromosome partitioning protein
MRYAIWNNKGGVGKTFLSFVIAAEYANLHPDEHVIVVDMCPQANLSEIILGGNGKGAENLQSLIDQRQTVGGYFDTRIASPHKITGAETDYLIEAYKFNRQIPKNLWLIAGDPSLEIQAQVINQISGQTLPEDAWKTAHYWLKDLVMACSEKLGAATTKIFIDCNPSFSAYTELAMMAAERLIVPCSSDGSSARAINNLGALLFGLGGNQYQAVQLKSRADKFGMPLPVIHSVLLNRSTQYNKKASKAFSAMFDAIKVRVEKLKSDEPAHFVGGKVVFHDIPDSHSVSIVCSHLGLPLYALKPGQYEVHDENPQVNPEPLERYNEAVSGFIDLI